MGFADWLTNHLHDPSTELDGRVVERHHPDERQQTK